MHLLYEKQNVSISITILLTMTLTTKNWTDLLLIYFSKLRQLNICIYHIRQKEEEFVMRLKAVNCAFEWATIVTSMKLYSNRNHISSARRKYKSIKQPRYWTHPIFNIWLMMIFLHSTTFRQGSRHMICNILFTLHVIFLFLHIPQPQQARLMYGYDIEKIFISRCHCWSRTTTTTENVI